jgi:hypothetical protein
MSGEDLRLLRKRAWLDAMIEKAMRRKRYVRLPPDHPLFDAEDLPHWWQRLFAEAIGGAILIAFLLVACWFAYYVMPNPLPGWLDWLATRL